ncbi:MAG: hypothetical protein MHPSP_003463 [Paramarteilia canceri]
MESVEQMRFLEKIIEKLSFNGIFIPSLHEVGVEFQNIVNNGCIGLAISTNLNNQEVPPIYSENLDSILHSLQARQHEILKKRTNLTKKDDNRKTQSSLSSSSSQKEVNESTSYSNFEYLSNSENISMDGFGRIYTPGSSEKYFESSGFEVENYKKFDSLCDADLMLEMVSDLSKSPSKLTDLTNRDINSMRIKKKCIFKDDTITDGIQSSGKFKKLEF